MSRTTHQPESDDLSTEIDKILTKVTDDLRKKIGTLISRREKKLLKSVPKPSKPSKKPADSKKSKKKYHSSASESPESS